MCIPHASHGIDGHRASWIRWSLMVDADGTAEESLGATTTISSGL
jgi:hypothetical protein